MRRDSPVLVWGLTASTDEESNGSYHRATANQVREEKDTETTVYLPTGVCGVSVVTQKPPVVAVRRGETVTMDCNLGTVTNSHARWYKQIPGGVTQFVLYFHHSSSSPTYGSGFSSRKFTSNHQSTSDYRLIINTVEEGDSAVYY
ncbi:immunoglobulin lambda-1 light chain-like protein, partial [Lates japonicus]